MLPLVAATFHADTCLEPSDATEDRSAYAEALEAQNNQGEGGVPFYPGTITCSNPPTGLYHRLLTRAMHRRQSWTDFHNGHM